LDKEIIVEVFKYYSLESILSIEEIKRGITKITASNEKKYIAKSSEFQSIKNQYEILSKLKQSNVPVAPILETMDGIYYVKIKEAYYCLYPFIEGECRKELDTGDGQEIINSFGIGIAMLHQGLSQVNTSNDFYCDLFMKKIFDPSLQVIQVYENNNTIGDIEHIIQQCKSFKTICKQLEIQMIHGDLHLGNIIYEDKKVNGFIDFESCTRGYRVYDLAYLMADILMQGFQKECDSQWLSFCNMLVVSYNNKNPFIEAEYGAIWYCMLFSQFFTTGYLYSIKAFNEAKRYLEGFFWIYENKDKINEALMK
jgi:Ser/Thr protein kinase RdoA (MazF antagonist)